MDALIAGKVQTARGFLHVHSAPRGLITHVDWAISSLCETQITLNWEPQPIEAGSMRASATWVGSDGFASRLVSLISKWSKVRMDITQQPSSLTKGERYSLTPNLGVFRAVIDEFGETNISESRIRAALARSKEEQEPAEIELTFLLGDPWDEELEPFRRAQTDTSVRWLNRTG
jgi:hypothetical protein